MIYIYVCVFLYDSSLISTLSALYQIISWNGQEYEIELWNGRREHVARHECVWISADYYALSCDYIATLAASQN